MNTTKEFSGQFFKINGEIVSRKIAGETFLVPIRGKLADMQNIFSLNLVAEYIWKHLDGQTSMQEILNGILEHFDVRKEAAMTDMQEFIAELLKSALITEKI